jgi:hypothetical protein
MITNHKSDFLNGNCYRLIVLVSIFFLNQPRICQAQPAGLSIGDMVRVVAPKISEKRFIGHVNFLTNKSMQLSTSDAYLEIPFNSIQTLEVARGKKSYRMKGLLIGVISGAAIGGGLGVLFYSPCTGGLSECFFSPSSRSQSFQIWAGIGGFIGGITGLTLGSHTHHNRWVNIPIETSVTWLPVDITNKKYSQVITLRYSFYKL